MGMDKKQETALHITADKREIKDFRKLPSATSFIRKPLAFIGKEPKRQRQTEK